MSALIFVTPCGSAASTLADLPLVLLLQDRRPCASVRPRCGSRGPARPIASSGLIVVVPLAPPRLHLADLGLRARRPAPALRAGSRCACCRRRSATAARRTPRGPAATRFRIFSALPRPLSISRPECPPRRPVTPTSSGLAPRGAGSHFNGPRARSCPCRPSSRRRATPSSSESRFSSIGLWTKPGSQVVGAGQAGLLVDGEQELQRTVLERPVLHDGQVRGDRDAVVRAERRAVGHQDVVAAAPARWGP